MTRGKAEFMEEGRRQMVIDIQQRVRRGEYEVDPAAVADALLRRAALRRRARCAALSQSSCSYPESGPSASEKPTSEGPSSTRPTQASSAWATLRSALSASPRALPGTQTQSS
jgi:hypothetical protein